MGFVVALGAFALVSLILSLRFGTFAQRSAWSVFQVLARARGYRLAEDRCGFVAVIGDVAIDVRAVVTPAHAGPTTTCAARAKVAGIAPSGRLAVRPKHAREPTKLRVGDAEFEDAFLVEGDSIDLACAVLDEEVRRALFAFGPRGETTYVDGVLTFRWDSLDGVDPREVDAAMAIARAACRRRPASPYRA